MSPPLGKPAGFQFPMSPETRRYAGLALMAALALYGIAYMRNPMGGHLIDGVDLAIHETGHLVFAPFGEIITALGGTLFQLIVPVTFVAYFVRRGDHLGAAASLWWVGQNCWHISVYVADARTQQLPLVGGGEHDWAFLLAEADLLRSDQGVARLWHAVGTILFLIAMGVGIRAALRQPPPVEPTETAGPSLPE